MLRARFEFGRLISASCLASLTDRRHEIYFSGGKMAYYAFFIRALVFHHFFCKLEFVTMHCQRELALVLLLY